MYYFRKSYTAGADASHLLRLYTRILRACLKINVAHRANASI